MENEIRLLVLNCFLLFTSFVSSYALPAFPGAEGFGASTPGGRGGQVIEVINLNDDGPGSFREACRASGPRIIVFRTGGTIELESSIEISNPFVTIAGQTAPGDGIVLKNFQLYTISHNVIIRGVRFRVGDNPDGGDPEERSSLVILGDESGQDRYGHSIIIDHCSMSWSPDQNICLWYGPHDITIQWCIISEGLLHSLHPKGEHSMGLLVGLSTKRLTVHHNLFAHNNGRNPLVESGTTTEIINNVVYDFGYDGGQFFDYDGAGPIKSDIVGNYLKPRTTIPGDQGNPFLFDFDTTSESRLYVDSNFCTSSGLWFTPEHRQNAGAYATIFPDSSVLDSTSGIVAQPPVKAYDTVLASAGAIIPTRDAVDARVVSDVRDSTGGIVNCVDSGDIYYPMDTARGGTDSTILLSRKSYLWFVPSNIYFNKEIEIIQGTGAGQKRTVLYYIGYDTATATPGNLDTIQEAYVDSMWDVIPDSTSVYRFIIPCDSNAGGWPVYNAGIPPVDTDHDGMPDEWENEQGLDPLDSSDSRGTNLSPEGYTNVEVYVNGLLDDALAIEERNYSTRSASIRLRVYPNPFNPVTKIAVGCQPSTVSNVELKIYDIKGNTIKDIKTDFRKLKSGITWNGKDNRGKALASGIYILKLKIAETVLQKRIFLIR